MNHFHELGLIQPLLTALGEEGYERPTPIQQKAIPHALTGKDLLGCAQTGTGKTAAFALPILQKLAAVRPAKGPRPVRALILAPTRELATQIGDSFAAYGRHLQMRHTVIFGGVGQNPQTAALRRGVDVVVATPGRLLDLMGQGHIQFGQLEVLVLDEADRMLDMGFIRDVRKIVAAVPKKRQTLFFSATMPRDIQLLASEILLNPVKVEVTPVASTPERIGQTVYLVEKKHKPLLLSETLRDETITRALVFTRTKHGANKVVRHLERDGIPAVAIHGNKSQSAREAALAGFKSGRTRVLVATDIAARGIDVDDISHVINYDIPEVAETYVHRIGRTARAGAEGSALSFCDLEERASFADIERLIRMRVPIVSEHGYVPSGAPASRPLPPRRVVPAARPRRPQPAAAPAMAPKAPPATDGWKGSTRSPGRFRRR